jgi:radical SAM superfamily enzyme YgiQ (UPF0313 family)
VRQAVIKENAMPKLILVNPVGRKSGYLMSSVSRFAPLGLGYVAAATPAHWDIKIVDENFERFRPEAADLVGITAFTSSINRAYAIAAQCRRQGIPVVLGGIHASMQPDEAVQYVDSVVVGEAEDIWPRVIKDFEKGRLQKIYRGVQIDYRQKPVRPRRDLFHAGYFWQSVQTSRGCPFDCHFCSVTRYLGRQHRQRPVADVLDELESIPSPNIAFVDDNLIGQGPAAQARARALLEGMIARKLNKRWWMQTSVNAADDEGLLRLAARAGCMFAFIGFETIDAPALKQMHKGINLSKGVANYAQVVRAFHRQGIGILGALILGFDFEFPGYYRRLARFMLASGIDVFQISLLTPLPGTRLMDAQRRNGQLIHDDFPADWEKYRFSYLVHQPRGVDIETVYRGDNYLKRKLYAFPFYQLRLLRSALALRNPRNFAVVVKLNQALKRSWQNAHYYNKYPSHFEKTPV